ncbi:MAG: NifB/NifX family molybdenum-iron cluster-binding protein [Thermoleophilia bacterium]
MKVAISAHGPCLEDPVDERFGRADYVLIVDTDSLALEALDNRQNQQALQGAGVAGAELVFQKGAQAVITGHLGPKAFRALSRAGIAGYQGAGRTVGEAVAALVHEGLPRLTEGDAQQGLQ